MRLRNENRPSEAFMLGSCWIHTEESHLGSATVSIIRDDPESSHKHDRKHVGDGTVPRLKGSRDGLIIFEWLLLFSQGIH